MLGYFRLKNNSIVLDFSPTKDGDDFIQYEYDEPIDIYQIPFYRLQNNKIIYDIELKNTDQEKVKIHTTISRLRYELNSTDYKVIKNYELIAAGLQPEYPVAELHAQRQAWRDEINALEFELAGLQ